MYERPFTRLIQQLMKSMKSTHHLPRSSSREAASCFCLLVQVTRCKEPDAAQHLWHASDTTATKTTPSDATRTIQIAMQVGLSARAPCSWHMKDWTGVAAGCTLSTQTTLSPGASGAWAVLGSSGHPCPGNNMPWRGAIGLALQFCQGPRQRSLRGASAAQCPRSTAAAPALGRTSTSPPPPTRPQRGPEQPRPSLQQPDLDQLEGD
jgi:hypothetical protein